MRKRTRDYENINDPKPEERLPGMKRIIYSDVIIDYSAFRKSPEEKIRLKVEKARAKTGIIIKRRNRGGKKHKAYLRLTGRMT